MIRTLFETLQIGAHPENDPFARMKTLKDEVYIGVNTMFPTFHCVTSIKNGELHSISVSQEALKVMITDIINNQDRLRQMGLVEEP